MMISLCTFSSICADRQNSHESIQETHRTQVRATFWTETPIFLIMNETTVQHTTSPNLEAAPAIPKLKHERETGMYLLAPLDVLDGDELLGPLVPDQPRHPEVAGPQLLQRLVPLLHQQRSRPRPSQEWRVGAGGTGRPNKRNLPAEKSQATNPTVTSANTLTKPDGTG